jgi:mannose-6-phosphate isomerase-like protein (cupin superfamily)
VCEILQEPVEVQERVELPADGVETWRSPWRGETRRSAGRIRAGTVGAVEEKVNLAAALASFDESFRPRIVAALNDYKVMVVKVKGEFVWHSHADTDDFFLVLKGRLTIQLRDRDVLLEPGELFVVPRGVEHCPRADEEVELLLIEPAGTVNTGDAEPSALTASELSL